MVDDQRMSLPSTASDIPSWAVPPMPGVPVAALLVSTMARLTFWLTGQVMSKVCQPTPVVEAESG